MHSKRVFGKSLFGQNGLKGHDSGGQFGGAVSVAWKSTGSGDMSTSLLGLIEEEALWFRERRSRWEGWWHLAGVWRVVSPARS